MMLVTGAALLLVVVVSFAFGVTALLSYLVIRMIGSDGWDHSNMTNALRLLSHVAMHPEDFAHMYYTVPSAGGTSRITSRKAFPYIDKDELSEVVKVRPTGLEVKE